MDMRQALERLCTCTAPSGFEAPAAAVAAELLRPLVDEVSVDRMGNVLGVRRCGKEGAPRLLLDAARPEILAQQDEDNGCKAQQHGQRNAVSALRVEQQVDPEHHDGQQAADEGAEESVAAVFDGILHIDAHAEDDADAGESRVAADESTRWPPAWH